MKRKLTKIIACFFLVFVLAVILLIRPNKTKADELTPYTFSLTINSSIANVDSDIYYSHTFTQLIFIYDETEKTITIKNLTQNATSPMYGNFNTNSDIVIDLDYENKIIQAPYTLSSPSSSSDDNIALTKSRFYGDYGSTNKGCMAILVNNNLPISQHEDKYKLDKIKFISNSTTFTFTENNNPNNFLGRLQFLNEYGEYIQLNFYQFEYLTNSTWSNRCYTSSFEYEVSTGITQIIDNSNYLDGVNYVLDNYALYGLYNSADVDLAYQRGLNSADPDIHGYSNVMTTTFNGAASILNTEVFPGITIGLIIGLPLLLSLLVIVIKIVRG